MSLGAAVAATRFHWLRLRTTCHATEDPDRVAAALATVLALEDDEAAAAAVEGTSLPSQFGGDVLVMEATLTRQREVRAAAAGLLAAFDAARLLEELQQRVDDDGVLYLRLDKQEAYLGDLVAGSGDDTIQVRLKVEVHPAGRERALAAWRAWLEAA
ncbi:MAG: RNA-binding domain-containing protein [Thermoplasmatota archaeon]